MWWCSYNKNKLKEERSLTAALFFLGCPTIII